MEKDSTRPPAPPPPAGTAGPSAPHRCLLVLAALLADRTAWKYPAFYLISWIV
ncbi:hypothetical protein SUBVAR_06452 [Subdoligranulum variabile DSM 15176]|uniref:Uncharacterized protein n=1 Tax=Subdoligranulum variabile DSM 15176 TaxID=411471 RepID=D1PPY5_9FIRM|nr:hypothetical protein SUBVAR_06452 [Subdoligranulum variabile DSM 15176]